jgi:hypothetical protein
MRLSEASPLFLGGHLSRPAGRVVVFAAIALVGLTAGCGKRQSSYKDRAGTVDPATAPIEMPDDAGSPKK